MTNAMLHLHFHRTQSLPATLEQTLAVASQQQQQQQQQNLHLRQVSHSIETDGLKGHMSFITMLEESKFGSLTDGSCFYSIAFPCPTLSH